MQKLIVVLFVAAACTKPNPNVCCTDEADCNTKGIPVGSICEQGLVCRGNQCISQPCGSSAECDATAPYCVAELCAESCSEDAQCPGFGQAATDVFCVDGACHQCRIGMNADCTSAAPVCDQGTCRQCREHDECQSGVCAGDGTCADQATIAYVETSGSSTSDCTRASPCNTVSRALTLGRPYVLIGSGNYPSSTTLTPGGQIHLIGSGTPAVLTRTTAGPVVTVLTGQVKLENLVVSGATTSASEDGNGVYCNPAGGAPALTLHRMTVRNNAYDGLLTRGCVVTVTDSTFSNNSSGGVEIIDGTGTVDRTLVSGNAFGMNLDSGVYQVTNNFIFRNDSTSVSSFGINLYSTTTGNRIEFNTIADNGKSAGFGAGFMCNLQGVTGSFPNNIIVRNRLQTQGASCSHPGSIIADTDVTAIKFKSPDSAPYDYHITAGSSAIDAATQSTVDHDFDGQPRTAPRDVGADEYVP